jgi:hypothetical protein
MMLKNPQKKSCLYNQHLKLNAFVRRTYPCSLKQTNMTKHEKFCTSYEEQLYDLHPGMTYKTGKMMIQILRGLLRNKSEGMQILHFKPLKPTDKILFRWPISQA